MLGAADRRLVAGDLDLPGLGVLLDAERLADVIGVGPDRLSPRYLRYKPATSCVLLVELRQHDGRTCDLVVHAVSQAAAAKAAKTLRRAPQDAVVGQDLARGVLVTSPAADRDLPGLRRLLTGRDHARLRRLSYKPSRRFVGLRARPHTLTPDARPRVDGAAGVVVRVYRRGEVRGRYERYAALAGGAVRTPAPLSVDARRSLLVVEHLPGRVLDGRRAVEAGSLAATLHEAGAGGRAAAQLPVRTDADEVEAAEAAAAALAVLLPDQERQARRVAAAVRAELGTGPYHRRAVCHGDLALDQVVADRCGGLALIDLDRACQADPGVDLASAAASALLGDGVRAATDLVDGYRTVRPLPERWEVHLAAHLLRRAVEPFRARSPSWEDDTRLAVALSAAALARGAEHAVDTAQRRGGR